MKVILAAATLLAAFSTTAFGAERAAHTGLNVGVNAGFQNVRGSFFQNDVKPGPAFKLDLGWRILPLFSLETGIAIAAGESKSSGETASFVHIANLDARFFPLGAGKLEPNLLAGWTIASGVTIDTAPDTSVTFTGYSPTLGAGARFHVTDLVYVQGDFRYLYTRFTDFSTNQGNNSTDGNLLKQEHGDAFMVLLGAGIQF